MSRITDQSSPSSSSSSSGHTSCSCWQVSLQLKTNCSQQQHVVKYAFSFELFYWQCNKIVYSIHSCNMEFLRSVNPYLVRLERIQFILRISSNFHISFTLFRSSGFGRILTVWIIRFLDFVHRPVF